MSTRTTCIRDISTWQAGLRLQPPGEAVIVPILVSTVVRMLVFAPAPRAVLARIPMGAAPWLVTAAAWWEWRRPSRRETRTAKTAQAAAPLPRFRLWTTAYILPVLLMLMARQLMLGVRIS